MKWVWILMGILIGRLMGYFMGKVEFDNVWDAGVVEMIEGF